MISVVRQSSYTASPAGHIIRLEDGFTLCHAGDTGIFSSIKNTVELFPINLAMLPIGGVFTMDPKQATFAATLLGACPRIASFPQKNWANILKHTHV